MTATESQIEAAAAAQAAGEAIGAEYHEAAATNPGVGLQVSLSSLPDSQWRPVIGGGYDVAPTDPALWPPVKRPRLVPTYAPEAVGGSGYHNDQPGTPNGLDGIPSWPSSSRSSSIRYISPRPRGEQPASEPAKVAESDPKPSAKSERWSPASGRIRKALRELLRK